MCTGPVEVGENAASNEVQLLYVNTVSCSPSLAKQAKTGFLHCKRGRWCGHSLIAGNRFAQKALTKPGLAPQDPTSRAGDSIYLAFDCNIEVWIKDILKEQGL